MMMVLGENNSFYQINKSVNINQVMKWLKNKKPREEHSLPSPQGEERNNKINNRKPTFMWKPNNTLLNDTLVKEG